MYMHFPHCEAGRRVVFHTCWKNVIEEIVFIVVFSILISL
jgi:hypothetical protein